MQDQDQRSKITVNYLDRTKDRDHWQRSWRSRSKIDDLPHLCLGPYCLMFQYVVVPLVEATLGQPVDDSIPTSLFPLLARLVGYGLLT